MNRAQNPLQLESEFCNIHFLSIYRASTGDFELFPKLNYVSKSRPEFAMCGVINSDCIAESCQKECLYSLLTFFNLTSVVGFPTRIQNYSSTLMDNE
jgi:hypothetical protein